MSGVTHVVLVAWSGDDRDGLSAQANRMVDAHLRGIPGVIEIDRGTSVSPEGLEGGHHWGMVIRFATVEERDAYLPDPSHRIVADFLGENAAGIVVFDLPAGAD
jgi:hypothetical protein